MVDQKISELTEDTTPALTDDLVTRRGTSNFRSPISGIFPLVSGDITINTSGVAAIGSGVIVNADINGSAAIDASKLSGVVTPAGAANLSTKNFTTSNTVANAFSYNTGVKQTFNGNTTNASINLNGASGDPFVKANGDLWHDSTAGKLRCQEGGTVKDLVSPNVVGTQQIFIPAVSMYPATTNPCSDHTKSELGTNDVDIFTLDFAGATANEIAKFDWIPPENWDAGTVNVKYYWTAAAGAGTVEFETSGVAISNDDALDAAFGTAVAVTDTFIAADDLHVSPQRS
jgi:hypothetical protein